MKSVLKKILQTLLGFDNYLFIFSLYIIYTLRWNKKEGDFLHFLKIIPGDKAVLDIGANIGIMTVHLARNFRKSTVYAFEPMPDNLKALQRIVRFFHLKNVKILNHALGSENGTIEMVMPVVKSVKMQGLSHVVDESIDSFNEGEKFTVNIFRLDDVKEIHQEGMQIGAIKMDVENFEYQVLEGGKAMIEKHRPIIYTELWDNRNRKDCFEFANKLGYGIKVLENDQLKPFNPSRHKTQNFFLLPEKSRQ
ncbi:MAG: FkbM family methyltransferase [Bacteroidales bacterium]|nr:FkbM family methyltransferase [Bacteroidales bacterium]